MPEFGSVLYEVSGRVARITLNRPEKLNAMNRDMRDGLVAALDRFESQRDEWVAIFTGAGGNFSVGLDLADAQALGIDQEVSRSIEDLYIRLSAIWKPTIAVIDGYCLAQGGGIALACDMRIMSSRAAFGWPQARRGLSSISGPAMLSAKAPLNVALEHLYTGEFIDAATAYRLNLVNRVVDVEQVEAETENLVERICQGAPLPMRKMKQSAVEGQGMTLPERVRMAGKAFAEIAATSDATEGLRAFSEKRTPEFRGE